MSNNKINKERLIDSINKFITACLGSYHNITAEEAIALNNIYNSITKKEINE